MAKAGRQQLSRAVEQRLRQFYRAKQCVVTGVDADWHHLDEDPSNSTFENVVPLCHPLNVALSALDRTKGGDAIIMTPTLLPDSLVRRAQDHYEQWAVWRAYGCARLATFIGKRYRKSPPSELAVYAVRSLWYARHRSEQHLFRDVLLRDLREIVEAQALDLLTSVSILHECASLLSEFGQPTLAEAVIARLNDIAPDWRTRVAEFPYRYAGAIRREALILLGTAGDFETAKGLLLDSARAAAPDLAAAVGAANALAWGHFLRGDPTAARDAIEPFLSHCLKKMVAGPRELSPIPIPLAMAAELVLIEYLARRASNGGFGDHLGQLVRQSLDGLAIKDGFKLPLVSPHLSGEESVTQVLQEFAVQGWGDWRRPPLDQATMDAIADIVARVQVRQ